MGLSTGLLTAPLKSSSGHRTGANALPASPGAEMLMAMLEELHAAANDKLGALAANPVRMDAGLAR